MTSLLANLHNRIKGSAEDVATLSLFYILENSIESRQAFVNLIYSIVGFNEKPNLSFILQSTGENSERPDMAGMDDFNREKFLFEAKFWAGLTENQPKGYLERLNKNKEVLEKGLVFISPHKRIISLWGELTRICEGMEIEQIDDNKSSDHRCIKANGVHLSIVSWNQIINAMLNALEINSPFHNDLLQLKGLCDLMDENAFLPFRPEDFGLDRANRFIDYYKTVDNIADELINKMGVSSSGLKATPQYAGYCRYLRWKDYGFAVQFNCQYWKKYRETPFWLTIKKISDNKWIYAKDEWEKLASQKNKDQNVYYFDKKQEYIVFPLYSPVYLNEREVTDHMCKSIDKIFKVISNE